MTNKSLTLFSGLSIAAILSLFVAVDRAKLANAAEEKTAVKVSDYASADDLIAAQKYFIAQLEEPLESKPDYAEDTQERVKKNALVIAILTMNLGLHDTKFEGQRRADWVFRIAIELAENVKDFDKTKKTYDLLLVAMKEDGYVATPAVAWRIVRGQDAIMKKTNELNSAIKRNLTPARFEKQLDALKYQTATMAAIGQATLLDTHEVKNKEDLPTYEKYSIEFRSAAAELNQAVHAKDQAAALKAFARMDHSCHTCHQKFDPPKK